MDNEYFRKIMTTAILIVLVVLSFFLLKPILLSIILGIFLAFIFTPIYNWIYRKWKMENLTASLMTFLLIALIVIPLWFIVPIMVNQSIKFYVASQQIDFVTPLKSLFPSLFETQVFSEVVGSAVQNFITKTTNSMMNSFSNVISNFPTLFLQLIVVLFTFFFVLRDQNKLINYIQSLIPFSKEVEKKLFKSSKDITLSILYGQVVIGMLEGIVAGIGFFLFKVPNAVLLTMLAVLAGIFPIIGTTIVWIPVVIYLIIANNTLAALGVALFGMVASTIDSTIKPVFVSKRTELNSSIILIGMIGGLFLFGILGIILGPLILAYLLIVLEIYRDKKIPGVFIQEPGKDAK